VVSPGALTICAHCARSQVDLFGDLEYILCMSNLVESVDKLIEAVQKPAIREAGRRVQFVFPYDRDLKNRLKKLGAKWDSDKRVWWAGQRHRNLDKMRKAFESWAEGYRKADRVEFEFEFDAKLKDALKSLGAKWDPKNKVWWVKSNHRNIAKMRVAYDRGMKRIRRQRRAKDNFKDEADRRRSEGLAIKVPYDIRKVAKNAGGIWDNRKKVWLMPDEESKELVQGEIQKFREEQRKVERQRKQREIKRELGFDPKDFDSITQVSRTKRDRRSEGDVFILSNTPRNNKAYGLKKGDAVYVEGVRSEYVSDDFSSFGGPPGWEDGWRHVLYIRPATDEEAGPVLSRQKKREARNDALKRVDEIEKRITKKGEIPRDYPKESGIRVLARNERLRLYGGGSWFAITRKSIWFIRNNGADGDNWARNNVRTGGAGAIGWRIKRNEKLADEMKSLHAVIHDDNPEDYQVRPG